MTLPAYCANRRSRATRASSGTCTWMRSSTSSSVAGRGDGHAIDRGACDRRPVRLYRRVPVRDGVPDGAVAVLGRRRRAASDCLGMVVLGRSLARGDAHPAPSSRKRAAGEGSSKVGPRRIGGHRRCRDRDVDTGLSTFAESRGSTHGSPGGEQPLSVRRPAVLGERLRPSRLKRSVAHASVVLEF